MRDNYVNLAEISRYIRHFTSSASVITSLDPLVATLISEQQSWLNKFSDILSRAETSRSQVSVTGADERDTSSQVSARLKKLYDQLKALEHDYAFDLKRFFETGRKSDIGESIASRTRTLERCLEGLKLYPTLPGASDWLKELEMLHEKFTGVSGSRSQQSGSKREDTQDLNSIRAQWKQAYSGTRFIVRGLLTRVGREAEWKGFFLDLQTSGPSPSSEPSSSPSESPVA